MRYFKTKQRQLSIFCSSSIEELGKDKDNEILKYIEYWIVKGNLPVKFIQNKTNSIFSCHPMRRCDCALFVFKDNKISNRAQEEYKLAERILSLQNKKWFPSALKSNRFQIIVYFIQEKDELTNFQKELISQNIYWVRKPKIADIRIQLAEDLLRLFDNKNKKNERAEKTNDDSDNSSSILTQYEIIRGEIKRYKDCETKKRVNGEMSAKECLEIIKLYRKADHLFRDNQGSLSNKELKCYCNLLYDYSDYFYQSGLYDFAEKKLKTQINDLEKIYGETNEAIANYYNRIGVIYTNLNDYPQGHEYIEKARRIRETLDESSLSTADSYHDLGVLYRLRGDTRVALKYLLKAKGIREKKLENCTNLKETFKLSRRIAESDHSIGFAYGKQGDYIKALHYHDEALKRRLQLLKKIKKGDLNEVAEKSEIITEESEIVRWIANSYNAKGVILYDQGRYKEALENHNKWVELLRDYQFLDHIPRIARLYLNLGRAYAKNGEKRKARRNLLKAAELFERQGNKTSVEESLGIINKINQDWINNLRYEIGKKRNLKLFIERFLSGPSWHQVFASGFVFVFTFVGLAYFFYDLKWGKAFVDMVSPNTLRSVTYPDTATFKYESDTAKYGHWIIVPDTSMSVLRLNTPLVVKEKSEEDPFPFFLVYFLGTLAFSGLYVATVTNTVRSGVDRFKQGKVNYWSFHRHIVFIGYNDMIPGIIKKIWEEEYPNGIRIVIGVRDRIGEVVSQLNNHLSDKQRKSVVVLSANSYSENDLKKRLIVHKAKEVYIIGDDDDGSSLVCYNKIQELCTKKAKKKREPHFPECYVHMQYQSTFSLFQRYQLKKDDDLKNFHAFNFHDLWAREMILNEKNRLDSRDGLAITASSDKHVHLVIVGMSEMGRALARETASLCHYPNYRNGHLRTTKITFVDPLARERMSHFLSHHRHFFNYCKYSYTDIIKSINDSHYNPEKDFLDIEFEFIQSDIDNKKMIPLLEQWAKDEKQMLTIALCMDQPHHSMSACWTLPEIIFDKNIPIWVYQPAKGDMADFLKRYKNIKTFGMSGDVLDVKNERILSWAKRLNNIYNNGAHRNHEKEIEEKEWNECSIDDKWSRLYHAMSLDIKKRSIGDWGKLDDDNIKIVAEVEHNRWNAVKLLIGFRPANNKELEEMKLINDYEKVLNQWFVHKDIKLFNELDDNTKEKARILTKEIPNIVGGAEVHLS